MGPFILLTLLIISSEVRIVDLQLKIILVKCARRRYQDSAFITDKKAVQYDLLYSQFEKLVLSVECSFISLIIRPEYVHSLEL